MKYLWHQLYPIVHPITFPAIKLFKNIIEKKERKKQKTYTKNKTFQSAAISQVMIATIAAIV